MNTGGQKMRF